MYSRSLLAATVFATCASAASSPPKPWSVPPTQIFEGLYGNWSTFEFQVGTPYQQVRLLPSTSGSTFAPYSQQECAGNSNPNCASSHGGTFDSTGSSTYSNIGYYGYTSTSNLDGQLGDNGNATFGTDNVQLSYPGGGGPTVNGTLISALDDDSMEYFYYGQFGLTPYPFNLTSLNNNNHTTVLADLKNNNKIPSLSFGYTAGSYNGNPPAPGSLVLGGYDQSKFRGGLSIPMSQSGGDIVPALRSVVINSQGRTTNALQTPIYVNIDSQIPTIILPTTACQAFEKAFGLTYSTEPGFNGFYFLNYTQMAFLQRTNPTVTFTLGDSTAGGSTIDIALPYTAFEMILSPPLGAGPNGTWYFPLQQANSTPYVLGRTFLQYAYLIADWDRRNYTVAPALFSLNSQPQVMSIYSPGESSSSGSSGLSGGAIAGIVIGVLAGVAIIAGALAFFFIRRRKQQRAAAAEAAASTTNGENGAWSSPGQPGSEFSGPNGGDRGHLSPSSFSDPSYFGGTFNKVELGGDAKVAPAELQSGEAGEKGVAAKRVELEAQARHEMGAGEEEEIRKAAEKSAEEQQPVFEMDAGPVATEMSERHD